MLIVDLFSVEPANRIWRASICRPPLELLLRVRSSSVMCTGIRTLASLPSPAVPLLLLSFFLVVAAAQWSCTMIMSWQTVAALHEFDSSRGSMWVEQVVAPHERDDSRNWTWDWEEWTVVAQAWGQTTTT